MSKLYNVEAIVLRARDFGEGDRILTLYTREQGKLCAIAKGVRKARSRLRGGVQLFAHTRLLLFRGKSLDTVSQAETTESFPALKEDLTRLVYASYLCELLEGAVPEREANEKLFWLTLLHLGLLIGEDPELVARMYELKLLKILGYYPHLADCMACRKPVGQGRYYLLPEKGGLLCQSCLGQRGKAGSLGAGTVLAMEKLAHMEPRMVFRLKVSPGQRGELEESLDPYLSYHLERASKAKKMMKSLFPGREKE